MKKVRFSEKIMVHEFEVVKTNQSESSIAADHHRFQMRIQRVSLVLNDVLLKKIEKMEL